MSDKVKCTKCSKKIPYKTAKLFENCCYQCHQKLIYNRKKEEKKKELEKIGYKKTTEVRNCEKCNKEISLVIHTKTGGLCYTCNRENIALIEENRIKNLNEKMINKPGCPMCDGTKSSYLSLPYDPKLDRYEYYKKYPKYIIKYREKNDYTIFSCSECNQIWFKHKNETSLNMIYPKYKSLFNKWLNNECIPNSEQIKDLKKIGTRVNQHNSQYRIQPIPCEITIKGRKKPTIALFIFTLAPPVSIDFQNAITPDKVLSISPSSKALPKDLIFASMMCQEYKMGFSPTIVKSIHNKKTYVLNGATYFFDKNDIDPKSLKVLNQNFGKEHYNIEVYNENISKIQIVFCNANFKEINTLL